MKFKNIKNIFAPEITEFNLTEKEIEYLSMLAAGVEKKRVMEILSITYAKIRDLYKKLGLTDKRMKRDIQAVTIMGANSLITDKILLDIYNKYGLVECKEFAELTDKA